jgi:hypothetical protein
MQNDEQVVGQLISQVLPYERPAIVITNRVGDSEETLEFRTHEDYAAWKALETE